MNKQNLSIKPDENQIGELLSKIQPVPGVDFHQRMAQAPWKIEGTNQNQGRGINIRVRLVLAALVVVAAVTLAASPQGQALARDILRRIGNFVITDEASDAEKYVATLQSGTPTPTPNPDFDCSECPKPFETGKLTVAQVSEKAGFPAYEPKYVPSDYPLITRDVLFTGSSITVHTSYGISNIIALSQSLVESDAKPWEMGVGDVPIVDVTVRGQAGVWLEQVPIIPVQDQQGEWNYQRWNQLIWAEDGYNFMLQTNLPSDVIPLSELLRIAESLEP